MSSNIVGNSGNNSLSGTTGSDSIDGAGGNDCLVGGAGQDTLRGNLGIDTLLGDAGSDSLFGDGGDDSLLGGADSDRIIGGSGNDTLNSDSGSGESLLGEAGNDVLNAGTSTASNLWGGAGHDSLRSTSSGNTLYGEGGEDTLFAPRQYAYGGDDNDSLASNTESSRLYGGSGDDKISASVPTSSFGTSDSFGVLYGDAGNDIIELRSDARNGSLGTIDGGIGDDTINHVNSNWTYGSEGNDSIVGKFGVSDGGSGDDTIQLIGSIEFDVYANGGAGHDSVLATAGLNIIISLDDGNDTVFAQSNSSQLVDLRGGAGDDSIVSIGHSRAYGEAGAGNDRLIFGAGSDTIYAGSGDDWVFSGAGNDSVFSIDNVITSDGSDTFDGGDGNDSISGGRGNDSLLGGAGNDSFRDMEQVSDGSDTIAGGIGNDVIWVHPETSNFSDSFSGGDGTDKLELQFASGLPGSSYGQVIVTMTGAGRGIVQGNKTATDYFSLIENISGSFGNDIIIGSVGSETISGYFGNNSISGGAGNDLIDGIGNDTVFWAPGYGDDTISANTLVLSIETFSNFPIEINGVSSGFTRLQDQILGNSLLKIYRFDLTNEKLALGFNSFVISAPVTDDLLQGGSEPDAIGGGAGNDVIDGGAGNDTVTVTAGSDSVSGGVGDDLILGNASGSGTLSGGAGNDSLVGTGNDLLSYAAATGAVSVNLATATANDGDGGIDSVIGFFAVQGGGFNDTIIASAADPTFSGLAGDDLLVAGEVDDSLIGEDGSDSLIGNGGNDTLAGGVGGDSVLGGSGDDLIRWRPGDGSDTIDGGSGSDTLDFGAGWVQGGALTSDGFATYTREGDTIWAKDIETFVICFYPGTLIATPSGPRAVETLAIGDAVLTSEGAVRAVRWMGRQTVSTRFADPLRVLPIRVRADAFASGVPERDLLVSPDHALLVEGVFAQAGALVNGTSILRERDVPERFTYHHVELATHELILAEGVPAETFVDNIDRGHFDNWAEHEALYGHLPSIPEMERPRAKAQRQVPRRVLAALAARAGMREAG